MSDFPSPAEQCLIGRQPVLEALKAHQAITKIYLQHGSSGPAIQQIREFARERGVPVTEVDKERIRSVAGDAPAQGVVALLESVPFAALDDLLAAARRRNEPPFLLILDEIEDPHNLGALIRSAECAGVHGVVIPKHHAVAVTPTVVKASAGAVSHLPIARVTNIATCLDELKAAGVWVVGTAAEGDRRYCEHDYRGPLAVVVGSEGRGMRRLVREKCDFVVTIPLYGKVGSLNASVAGAVVLFEAARSRHAAPEVQR